VKERVKRFLGNALVCPNCLRLRSPLHWLLRKLGMCDEYYY
jgi:hypothetical protein